VANYRVSTECKKQQTKQNSHNENKTRKKIKRKNDRNRLFKFKYVLLKISTNLQSELAAETHLTVEQWLEDQLNIETISDVPSRNKQSDCFEETGAEFSASKDIY
jgi:hypothetical protein